MIDPKYFNPVFKASPLPSLLLLPDFPRFTIQAVNVAYLNITGMQEEDLIGKGIFEVFPDHPEDVSPDGGSAFRESLLTLINTGKTQSLGTQRSQTAFHPGSSATMTYWEIENTPVFDPEGNIALIIHSVTDVTEKKLLQMLINSTDDNIWSVNPNFKLIAANKALVKGLEGFTGITVKPGDDLLMQGVFPADYLSLWRELYQRALSGEAFKKEIVTPVFKDVLVSWSEISFNPVYKGDIVVAIACYSRNITEKKLAEGLLRKSEARLAEAQGLAKLGNWNFDFDADLITWSEQLYNVFDTDKQTFTGTYDSYLALVDVEDRDFVLESNRHTRQTGEPSTLEYHITTSAGEKRVIQANAYAEQDANGKIIRLFGTAQDITERKKSEERTRFQAELLNTIGQAVMATDLDGIINFWNRAAEDIYGWTATEALGKNILDISPAKESKDQAASIMQKLSKGQSWSGEFLVQRKSGQVFPAFVTDAPIYDANHKLSGIIGVSSDITERKKIEHKLLVNEHQLDVIYNTVADVIFMMSVEENDRFKFISVNHTFLEATGLTSEQLIGQYADDIIPPSSWSIALLNYKKAIKTNSTVQWEEISEYPSGIKVGLVSVTPVLDDEGVCMLLVGSVHDITERQNAERDLRNSEEKYRILFLSSPLPKWIYDLETLQILDVNDAAIGHYGYSREEFTSMTILDIRVDGALIGSQDFTQRTESEKNILRFGLFTHQKKNGSHIQVEVSGSMFMYEKRDCIVVECVDVTEREKALNILVDREAKLENAQRTAKLGYWRLFMPDNTLYWSTEVYNICGVNKDQLPDFDLFFSIIHPDDRDSFMVEQNAFLDEERELDAQHRIVLPDGSIKWVHEKGRLERDKDQHIIVLEGTVQDITAQKMLTLSLEESNQRYNYVTKATSEAIWDWDFLTDIIYWGEGFQKIFGYELKEIKSDITSWTDHIHPQDIDRVVKRIYELLDGPQTIWEDEYRFRKNDNTYAYVTDKGFIIRNDAGEALRMVGAMQDITKRKEEEHHLRLLESVITNTTDSVLITEAGPIDGPGPRIIYVNEAFTRMTGYTAEEVIGKTPRILQGPKSDKKELKRLYEALQKWETCEITTINYKKDGTEFWINFSVSPIANEKGWFTQWIAIERDVTQQKNEELQKTLLVEISQLFNEPITLNETLKKVLERLVDFGGFSMAEAWLLARDQKKIRQVARLVQTDTTSVFYDESTDIKLDDPKKGLLWNSTENGSVQIWQNTDIGESFIHTGAAKTVNLHAACKIPIIYNNEAIGVFILGLDNEEQIAGCQSTLFQNLGAHAGAEIKRKQLELDLNQIFSFAPDIICIAGVDGYFKKINPAGCELLEYTEEELLAVPFADFIYPADKGSTALEIKSLARGIPTFYFENRYVTRSGKIKWLAWTSTSAEEEGLVFGVAKDITDKKELENLLNKATDLSRIGGWELDAVKGTIYWSPVTSKIHEVAPGFQPDLSTAINFYKEGASRDLITKKIREGIENGKAWDAELLIITAKGNEIWVRAIGEPQILNGKCVSIAGSLQDINIQKRAELAVIEVLEEKNIILESIADAFFAVDKNWTVTYWNNQAEKMLTVPRNTIVGYNLWEVFPSRLDSVSYREYHFAMETNEVVHFEDYYISRWYEVSAYPSNGGLSVYFKDVTERKQSEIQLKELNESLHKQAKDLAISNAELEQFAYVASHDLQEPLRMVTSFLTLLEKKYGNIIDDKGKKYIDFAVDGAKRMRHIILDLLEFSRVGRIEDSEAELDLNELVNEIKILFRKEIEDKRAVINTDSLPVIHAHTVPLRQVFQNLISNALKYSKDGIACRIGISVTDKITHWQFAITDNGIGISAEYFDRIFIIFQRLHTKEQYSGTGMGLAVTKKIIENYGGRIWVESEEEIGSTFYFTLLKQSS